MPAQKDDRTPFRHLLELMDTAGNVDEAIEYFCNHYQTPFVAYHLLQAVAPKYDAPFVRTTYPEAWVGRYLLKDYVKIDPVARAGFQRLLPFEWAELEIPENAVEFMRDAADHGIVPNGYSIPIIDRIGRRALFSINALPDGSEWKELVAANRSDWAELAYLIHRKAIVEMFGQPDPTPRLGPREIECLQWAARGKDSKAIAIMLGLSDHTVRSYLKSAKFKLECSSLTQAVSKAITLRLIKP